MTRVIRALLIISFASGSLGQVAIPTRQVRSATARRIADLSTQLRVADAVDHERYRLVRDPVTFEIHSEVDGYIARALDPVRVDSVTVERDLGELLGSLPREPEGTGAPFGRLSHLRHGRSLVVGYAVVRGGGNDSSVTIRGYRLKNDRFELAASTGGDFDGYGLFVRELRSPVPQETWILAWGPRFTFNGNKVRMRVYAYDGDEFRTVWSPQDALNVTITVNDNGFTVDRLDEQRYYVTRRPPYYLRDEYALTPSGPIQLVSSYRPE